jgi:hypothetical protein
VIDKEAFSDSGLFFAFLFYLFAFALDFNKNRIRNETASYKEFA